MHEQQQIAMVNEMKAETHVFQQNQRCEVRDLGSAAGALQSEPGRKQQNFIAIPIGRPWDKDCNPTLTQCHDCGGIASSNQELFAQNYNGLVMEQLTSVEPTAIDGFNANVVGNVSPTITGMRVDSMNNPLFGYRYSVRRITPIEGERLQGFADNWTRPCFTTEEITEELVDRFVGIHQNWSIINGTKTNKPKSRKWIRNWLEKISSEECPDGPRYKAIGNSMSVNVMTFIGRCIEENENENEKGTNA